ncbi:hypothetical protein PUNSTDRAFT_99129 [Punctularia strigosozonata HHB-11173 SS5]|uniref:uncharacterized protein n=1 Tax=Punctularia strigosozonata (strain HHB-11173) TaxID=741275 RepID=UPI0004417A4E|nr:uncharacterized protein PUNSTDRAFT_99129 [Punctularia strigosozonata HHB-11173 SS5]EIN11853.1 hypothetical protein PUNSTDRAFT_99129 [Punctularia strigosozonata HHB-11173 SS5]
MAQLSAADLQRRLELEGAPDPFPALGNSTPAKARAPAAKEELDTDSQTAFPSLAPAPSANKAAAPAWRPVPRLKAIPQPMIADSFDVAAVDLSSAGKDGKPTSLSEVMKQVASKYKVKLEASTNQRTRQTTFHLKADSQKDLDKAKKSLMALLSPVVTLTVNAPASTIPAIIGPKGATLKLIRDQTGVKVDIPRKDASAANGHTNGVAPSGADEEEEPTVPVTITGAQPLALEAQTLINQVIASKTSRSTQRVRDIPVHVLPFIKARRAVFEAAAEGGDVNLALSTADREITVSGDREAVGRVVDVVKSNIESLQSTITSLKISLPKRQHRLLSGKAVDEIVAKSRCSVLVASPDEASDEVTVWGQALDLPQGLAAVMEKANSQYIHEFPLPGPITLSRQLLTYMTRINYPKTLSAAHPGVQVFTPSPAVMEKAAILNIELIGDKPAVDGAVRQVSELIGKLIGGIKEVSIDWLLHRILQGTKNAKKLKQFHDVNNVSVFFPPESAEQSSVLLVYDPSTHNASRDPVEKSKQIEDVEHELLEMVKEAADVKTESVSVETKWHEAVIGKNSTTLNAIIGEEKTLSIKLGKDVGDSTTEDIIVVRGARADVDRAVKEIKQIVEDAKNDEIVSSYSVEFEVDREFVGRIVGSQGAGVNRIRDQLGVKVDFSDEPEDKEKEGGKKKKGAHQKSHVKITGRKENVEEAKKRILTQVERLADETSEILKIPTQYHASLIGQSGKYAIRLEEKYGVKITFPRQAEGAEAKTREVLKADEVLVKGGKKGVAGAKSELLEALDYEKENSNVVKFTVPTRAVARVLGKGGATINEIKDETSTQIDVEKGGDDHAPTNITIRGTKKAIQEAKAAILSIADQVGEEANDTVTIESKFHRTIIGAGGQGLRELIQKAGGPSDPRQQAGLIRFPRQGESGDEVRLRGDPKVVAKLKTELEKVAASLRDRVVLAIEIPAAQHRALIGRGGQHLNDLQSRTGCQVQFPGSRSYHSVGDAENAADVKDVDPADIVKVSGPRAACEAAIAELKKSVKAPGPPPLTATVTVPLKYHHFISQQGNFFRNLRSFGVTVEHSALPQKAAVPAPPPPAGASDARIDDAGDDTTPEVKWQVVPNYQDAEEGESEWTLKARDDAALEKAKKRIADAIDQAEKMSHVGFLTMPDRSAFPRIVGSKGANVARLRDETGADITLSRENTTIVIIGSESAIEAAREAIQKMASSRPGRRGRDE